MRQDESKTYNEGASIISDELVGIYNAFQIPVNENRSIKRSILRANEEYTIIKKSQIKGSEEKKAKFAEKLDVLFDISHVNALETLTKERKQFVIDVLNEHRDSMEAVRARLSLSVTNNKGQSNKTASQINSSESLSKETSDTTHTETDESVYEPPKKTSRTKKSTTIIDARMTQALDRNQISNIAASSIIGQIAHNLGHDINALHISPEYIRQQRLTNRKNIYNEMKKDFSPNATFTVHWDGTTLEDYASKKDFLCNRLAIILSSGGNSKLLGIPKVAKQTGVIEGAAVYEALLDWHVEKNIMAMCFDTTASNTSTSVGVCAILELKLNRHLLHFACRHHILELLVGAAFKATVEPSTSGPRIQLLEKFRRAWPELRVENWEAGITDPDVAINFPSNVRNDTIDFIKDQLQNKVKSSRGDYIEMLKLCLLFLGGEIPGYTISKPGAYSHARWMAKIIYTLKIFLLRNQFSISCK